MIMIMGDYNARVVVEQGNTAGGIIDKNAIDKQNQNDRRLVDFCLFVNSFIVIHTFFPHKAVHRKFRSSGQNVRIHRDATGGIGKRSSFITS